MDDIYELKLRKPVQVGDVRLTSLTLKEPTAAQLRISANNENGVHGDIILIGLVADVSPALVERLGSRDFMEAARWLGNFTRSDPPSGTAGSQS